MILLTARRNTVHFFYQVTVVFPCRIFFYKLYWLNSCRWWASWMFHIDESVNLDEAALSQKFRAREITCSLCLPVQFCCQVVIKWLEIIFSHLSGGGGPSLVSILDDNDDDHNDGTTTQVRHFASRQGGAHGLKFQFDAVQTYNVCLHQLETAGGLVFLSDKKCWLMKCLPIFFLLGRSR